MAHNDTHGTMLMPEMTILPTRQNGEEKNFTWQTPDSRGSRVEGGGSANSIHSEASSGSHIVASSYHYVIILRHDRVILIFT